METDSLFSPEYEVTGSGASRVLKRLARPGLMLNMMSQGESDGRLASVIDRIEGDASKLIVDQPPDLSRTLKEFESGQTVWLMWADAGMRYGAQARILQVHEQGRSISYRLVVEGCLYRQQRRTAFRVPVGPADGVAATFSLPGHNADVSATLKDISMTGCRLLLPRRKALPAGMERDREVGLQLVTDNGSKAFECRIRIVWIRRASEEIVEVGGAWVDPDDRLLSRIQRFVVLKERKLLKQRSGL